MDWLAIRQVASDMGVNSSFCGDAWLGFIPAEPNKKADAEWLLKRDGWRRPDNRWLAYNDKLELVFEGSGAQLVLRKYGHEDTFVNPTRMTVALFEAAAMEAIKHGE